MTRFTTGLLFAGGCFAIANVGGYLIPLGVDGFEYRCMGFPKAFWTVIGTKTHFHWIRFSGDLLIAVVLSYSFARWYESNDPKC